MTNKENTPEKPSNEGKPASKKQTKKSFWRRNFLNLLLLLGIAIAVVWGMVEKNRLEKSYKAEVEQLNSDHKKAMDSIVQEKAKIITSTLALAVRSELIDENKDQVNQYFLQMIKNKQISKIMLVNHSNGEIEMSTNKKDENMTFKNEALLKAKDVVSENKEDVIITATPIMGLNKQMAVLVVETTK